MEPAGRLWHEWTERDVYVASLWHRHRDMAENPRARKLRALKRPEGRAPAQIVVAVPNTFELRRDLISALRQIAHLSYNLATMPSWLLFQC
jgi:hypothetical protein